MRVLVVHLISFLVVLIAIFMNFYFLIRGRGEYSKLSNTINVQYGSELSLEDQLNELVENNLLSYEKEITELRYQLKQIKKDITDYNAIYNDKYTASCNLVNYADEKLGATIRSVRADPVIMQTTTNWLQTTNPPVNIIRAGMEPGCCYAFKNSGAEIEIKLAKEALVENVKIEHISKSQSPTKDTSSAPRNFSVYGIDEHTGEKTHLGDFEFTNEAPSQVFTLPVKRYLRIIGFNFKANHGNPKYTCVYRVLVYGRPK